MALVKYNDNSISDITDIASSMKGAMTLIKTVTASSDANVTFAHGTSDVVLDSTYPIYKIVFINVHPATYQSTIASASIQTLPLPIKCLTKVVLLGAKRCKYPDEF